MKVYGDQDADISYISKKVVAILGYGNQGRAQALNLRDSGVSVVVGNIEDSYAQTARSDGFEVYSPAEAAQRGDILALLVPDEVQAEVYATSIAPHIRPRQVLDFAAGYNIHFGLIRPPADVDVIMVAPRMIGVNVRRAFETGGGVPAFVDVWQNASGQGMEIALAFAKGIGATRAGVLPVSFRDEVEIDLFTEQALWPAIVNALVTSYELLVEKGYAPEAVLMELWGTGEAAEIMTEMARTGLFRQMTYHSRTSQYGTLTNFDRVIPGGLKANFETALERIRSGKFAEEFAEEKHRDYPVYQELRKKALAHSLNEVEDKVRNFLDMAFKAGTHQKAAAHS